MLVFYPTWLERLQLGAGWQQQQPDCRASARPNQGGSHQPWEGKGAGGCREVKFTYTLLEKNICTSTIAGDVYLVDSA